MNDIERLKRIDPEVAEAVHAISKKAVREALFNRVVKCPQCQGRRTLGYFSHWCDGCNGKGTVILPHFGIYDYHAGWERCPYCFADQVSNKKACAVCTHWLDILDMYKVLPRVEGDVDKRSLVDAARTGGAVADMIVEKSGVEIALDLIPSFGLNDLMKIKEAVDIQEYELNFKSWMQQVDDLLAQKVKRTHKDLPDQPYQGWFDNDATPACVVEAVLIDPIRHLEEDDDE